MGQSGFCATSRARAGMGKHTAHATRAVKLAIPAIDGVTWARPHAKGTLLSIRLQPRAARNEVVGEHAGALKIKITGGQRSKCGAHQIFGQPPKLRAQCSRKCARTNLAAKDSVDRRLKPKDVMAALTT